MTKSLNLECHTSGALSEISPDRSKIHLLLEVNGGVGAQSLPSNLAFTLDISDSMKVRMINNQQFKELAQKGYAHEIITDGVPAYQITDVPPEYFSGMPRRIDYVVQALKVAGDYLRMADRYSIVVFSGRAYCLVPSISGDAQSRMYYAARELERLSLGNETRMDEGMQMALREIMKSAGSAYASRVILLTDGHTQNVRACYHWAEQAKEEGIKITTIGIGNQFNEDLLIPLADMTGGNAYYIEMPEQIPEVFEKELGSALRVSYRNVEVKILLEPNARVNQVFRVKPELSPIDPDSGTYHSFSFYLGDYDPAMPQALLLEIELTSLQKGKHRIGQALLRWDDPSDSTPKRDERKDIYIKVSDKKGKPNGRVMNFVEKVGAYKLGTHALDAVHEAVSHNNADEIEAATLRLRQVATRLLDMGEESLAKTMLQQAESLKQKGDLDPDAAKKIRYETRRLTQRLK